MATRIDVDPRVGDTIINLLQTLTGQEVDIILIVLPSGIEKPQPTFVTNFPPDVSEDIIKQIAEQMTPEMSASRQVKKRGGYDA